MSVIKTGTTSTTGYIVESDTNGNLVIQTGSTPTTALTLNSNQTATFAQSVNIPNTFGFKNRIINGGMVIDQRNAGAATANTINGYVVDRWYVLQSTTGKLIAQQNAGSVTPPVGFTNYLGITSQSAYSVGAAEYYFIFQAIEGLNVADLGWGTANAQTVTMSFWVRSSLTGTFGGALKNSAGSSNYPFTYTISSANTWEQKTITITGPTSGTWLTNNGVGIYVQFGLGVGSTYSGTAGSWQTTSAGVGFISVTGAVSVVGTNGATFYITGVQLERGSTATSFDFRPYGTELMLCMRYFQRMGGVVNNFGVQGYQLAGGGVSQTLSLPVPMRAAPTATLPTMSNINTTGLIVNAISAECALILAAATANGSVSSINTGAGYATFSIEL